jgi:hypothetical protein
MTPNGTPPGPRKLRAWPAMLILALAMAISLVAARADVSYASHGDDHAMITYWDLAFSPFNGFDPHEQLADVAGQTNHLADSTPTMVTAMENGCGGFCAIMFWNPDTNDFETICVTGGLDFAVDVNRSSTLGAGTPGNFGGGDAWSAVFGNSGFSPYVVYRGNDTTFSRFDTGTTQATGIRVNPSNGRVYFGNFFPGQIVELDPATNAVRKWNVGNRPYFLVINGSGLVYATAVGAPGGPGDQIIRLDPATNTLTRWNVPGAMNFTPFVGEGNPNYISLDTTNSRRLWFSETESDEVARLDTSANTITEWTKAGISHPNAINNSGALAFFTEAGPPFINPLDPGHISVLNVFESTVGVTTPAPPTTETIVPVSSTATRFEGTPIVRRATITPSVFDSPGVDPSGFTRFPVPPGTDSPTGMTGVFRPQTVAGSIEGTHHVFTLRSDIIVVCELTLEPSSASNPVGTPHTVTATVTCDGTPQAGVVVTFTVMGTGSTPTPPVGACTTGPDGRCTFTYTSPTPGEDVIRAEATVQGQVVSDTATKTWTGVVRPPCPPEDDDDDDGHEDDDDNDGLTNKNENLLFTLIGISDSDFDGIVDGNDDSNGNGEDDEDEDDDDDCPDEDEDGDGEDDEDEDDDDDDDDDD